MSESGSRKWTGCEEGFSMRRLFGVLILGLFVSAGYVLQAQAPLTAADYPAKMKAVAAANGMLQKALKSGAAADAVAPAKELVAIFADVEKFWAAQMAAGNATANCKQCHGLYREGDPQAGFKIKGL